MNLKKRTLTCLIAGALALSMMAQASATGVVEEVEQFGSSTATGGGKADYVDTQVVSVTIPTSEALNFRLDPQGLSMLGKCDPNAATGCAAGGIDPDTGKCAATGTCVNALTTLDDLAPYAGKIIFENESVPVLNNSSVPVTVTTQLRVTGQATQYSFPVADFPAYRFPNNASVLRHTVGSGTAARTTDPLLPAQLVSGKEILDGMKKATTTTMVMYAKMGTSKIQDPDDADGNSPVGFVFGTSAASFKFVLDKANYSLPGGVPTPVANSGDGTSISLGGFANPNANWFAFTEEAIVARRALAAQINNWNNANPARNSMLVDGTPGLVADAGDGTTTRLGAEDLSVFVVGQNEMLATASQLIAVPKSLSATTAFFASLQPVTSAPAGLIPTGTVAGNGAAIAANTPYISVNPAYANQLVKSAAITAANNRLTASAPTGETWTNTAQARVPTFRAWAPGGVATADTDILWLPAGITPVVGGIAPTSLPNLIPAFNNAAARTIGVEATFRISSPTTAETTAAANPALTRTNATVVDGRTPFAYGLIGATIQSLRAINPDNMGAPTGAPTALPTTDGENGWKFTVRCTKCNEVEASCICLKVVGLTAIATSSTNATSGSFSVPANWVISSVTISATGGSLNTAPLSSGNGINEDTYAIAGQNVTFVIGKAASGWSTGAEISVSVEATNTSLPAGQQTQTATAKFTVVAP